MELTFCFHDLHFLFVCLFYKGCTNPEIGMVLHCQPPDLHIFDSDPFLPCICPLC